MTTCHLTTTGLISSLVEAFGMKKVLEFIQNSELGKGKLFPSWKTIKLGTKSLCGYCEALGRGRHIWNRETIRVIERTPCTESEESMDLVILSVSELGFDIAQHRYNGVPYGLVCARALLMGLELCPAEVGLALRLQYQDQPTFVQRHDKDIIYVAMNGLSVPVGSGNTNTYSYFLGGFSQADMADWHDPKDSLLMLGTVPADLKAPKFLEYRFVFVKPKT